MKRIQVEEKNVGEMISSCPVVGNLKLVQLFENQHGNCASLLQDMEYYSLQQM